MLRDALARLAAAATGASLLSTNFAGLRPKQHSTFSPCNVRVCALCVCCSTSLSNDIKLASSILENVPATPSRAPTRSWPLRGMYQTSNSSSGAAGQCAPAGCKSPAAWRSLSSAADDSGKDSPAEAGLGTASSTAPMLPLPRCLIEPPLLLLQRVTAYPPAISGGGAAWNWPCTTPRRHRA